MHSLPAFGALVLLGSAVPFVPTGELVSSSAALITTGGASLAALFVVSWLCSVAGDTALLLQARLGRRRIQSWLERRLLGQKSGPRSTPDLEPLEAASVFSGQISLRRFLLADTIACAITGNPIWGLVIAIAAAVSLSALLPLASKLFRHRRRRRERTDTTTAGHSTVLATASNIDPRNPLNTTKHRYNSFI